MFVNLCQHFLVDSDYNLILLFSLFILYFFAAINSYEFDEINICIVRLITAESNLQSIWTYSGRFNLPTNTAATFSSCKPLAYRCSIGSNNGCNVRLYVNR